MIILLNNTNTSTLITIDLLKCSRRSGSRPPEMDHFPIWIINDSWSTLFKSFIVITVKWHSDPLNTKEKHTSLLVSFTNKKVQEREGVWSFAEWHIKQSSAVNDWYRSMLRLPSIVLQAMSYSTFIFAQASVPEMVIPYVIVGQGAINVLSSIVAVSRESTSWCLKIIHSNLGQKRRPICRNERSSVICTSWNKMSRN